MICYSSVETVMNCFTGVNTPTGEDTLLNSIKVLHHARPAFAVYTCPQISFCIGCCDHFDNTSHYNKLIVIDAHCIPVAAGRNGNGTVVQIKYYPCDMENAGSKLTKWIKRWLLCSNRGGKVQSLMILKKVWDNLQWFCASLNRISYSLDWA